MMVVYIEVTNLVNLVYLHLINISQPLQLYAFTSFITAGWIFMKFLL